MLRDSFKKVVHVCRSIMNQFRCCRSFLMLFLFSALLYVSSYVVELTFFYCFGSHVSAKLYGTKSESIQVIFVISYRENFPLLGIAYVATSQKHF